jgi:EthD domain
VVKVMWLVKRAEHLSLEEFAKWWTEVHAPDIRDEQVPHLVRYIVNVRTEDNLPAKPDSEPDWDGIAEEWFATEAAFAAVYGKEDRDAHDDAEAHTSRVERLVVREITFA